jgi:hypothetical protein
MQPFLQNVERKIRSAQFMNAQNNKMQLLNCWKKQILRIADDIEKLILIPGRRPSRVETKKSGPLNHCPGAAYSFEHS